MATTNRRPDRVAEAMREEIAMFLREGAKDPRVSPLTTVTGVDVARDLRSAKVFVSVMGEDEERAATLEALESMTGKLRGIIGRNLRLQFAPELSFRMDESLARAARIEQLLQQVRDEAAAEPGVAEPGAPADGDAGDGDDAGAGEPPRDGR